MHTPIVSNISCHNSVWEIRELSHILFHVDGDLLLFSVLKLDVKENVWLL